MSNKPKSSRPRGQDRRNRMVPTRQERMDAMIAEQKRLYPTEVDGVPVVEVGRETIPDLGDVESIPVVRKLRDKETERRLTKHVMTKRIQTGTLQGGELARAKAEYKKTYGEDF